MIIEATVQEKRVPAASHQGSLCYFTASMTGTYQLSDIPSGSPFRLSSVAPSCNHLFSCLLLCPDALPTLLSLSAGGEIVHLLPKWPDSPTDFPSSESNWLCDLEQIMSSFCNWLFSQVFPRSAMLNLKFRVNPRSKNQNEKMLRLKPG